MPATNDNMTCDYCGQLQEHVAFFIGAKLDDDIGWTMHEGTGKMSCSNCYPKGKAEAKFVIDKYAGRT